MRVRPLHLAATAIFALSACVPAYQFNASDAGPQEDARAGAADAGDDALATPADGPGPDAGQGSDASPADAAPPPVQSLAAGSIHTCVLRGGGSVYCWGDDGSYELGRGWGGPDASDYHPGPVLALADAGGLLSNASTIASGSEYSCTLVGDTPYCWGSDANAQLGDDGYTNQSAPTPVLSALSNQPLTGITRVVTGGIAACAQSNDGNWACWGNNLWGQLTADVGLVALHEATIVPALTGAIAVGMGAVHTCAVRADGTVICFGSNDQRQVGQAAADLCTIDNSTAPCVTHPVVVQGLAHVKELALETTSSCALDETGAVYCWGADRAGELGTNDAGSACLVEDAGVPCSEVPSAIPLGRPAVRISGGEDYNGASYCAVFADGSMSCWGSNTSGQLGIGMAANGPNPIPATPRDVNGLLSGVVEVSSGDTHRCALIGDAAVLCWGMTDPSAPDGRLGTPNIAEPYAVPVDW